MTDWKKDLGAWQKVGTTRSGQQVQQQQEQQQLRVEPDSPDRAAGLSNLPSHGGTPRSSASLTGKTGPAASGSLFDFLGLGPSSMSQQQQQQPKSSVPFWTPPASGSDAAFSTLRIGSEARFNDNDVANDEEAEFYNPSSLRSAQQFVASPSNKKQKEQEEGEQEEGEKYFHYNENQNNNNNNQNSQKWVAFAPLLPEEVHAAVASIQGAFPEKTISRYSVEKVLASRFNLNASQTQGAPTVLALVVFAGSRDTGLQLIQRHERSPLFNTKLYHNGQVKAALSAGEPRFSLWCGKLSTDPSITSMSASVSSFFSPRTPHGAPTSSMAHENREALELASHVRKGNESVCRRLEVRQAMPLSVQLVYFYDLHFWNAVYLLCVALFIWWAFF